MSFAAGHRKPGRLILFGRLAAAIVTPSLTMKNKQNILHIALATALMITTAHGQGTFTFNTSVGSGSFTLNPNNLVFTGDDGSAAGYNTTSDSLTFNGITYTNLDFSVYNNSFIVGLRDGFQILVDKSPHSSAARLEINVAGDPTVINGIGVADLWTVLNSFTALQAVSFSTSVLYINPNPPFDLQVGTVTSFGAVPEPSVLALVSLSLVALRRRRLHA
jgi:hypothetical protein